MPSFAVSTPFELDGYNHRMSTISTIGLSGMRAATARLQAAASNIANAQTNGRLPSGGSPKPGDVYQPVDAVQVDQKGGGVATSYATRQGGYSIVSDPGSPFADANGNVAAPAVDLATEMVNMIIAKYQFAASTKVVEAGDQMQKATLDTLA